MINIDNSGNEFVELENIKDIKDISQNNVRMSIENKMDGIYDEIPIETNEFSAFLKSIASIPVNMKFEERILNKNIQIDGNLAHVWTPYEFYINDQLSHIGANSFTLYNENGKWHIIHLIDTRRKK